MTDRIHNRIIGVTEAGEKALALFTTAGFPRLDSLAEVVPLLEKGGADIVEIGMPFSDPLADGPAIQHSSMVALKNGITLDLIFEQIRIIRRESSIPIALMGYLNPILRYGLERFLTTAAESGVDGLILPELPLEESEGYRSQAERFGLSTILLVTPTTSTDRIGAIDGASSGFLYCVSTTGVTGTAAGGSPEEYIQTVKLFAKRNPVLVGFGVSSHESAHRFARSSDGVVIGSALIKLLEEGVSDTDLEEWVAGYKASL
ncbi:MAG: tryptophan synthase subunit alpha [Bacteroidota bacterium]